DRDWSSDVCSSDLLHRVAAIVPVLLLVTAGVFALLHLTPGDPIDAMMAESVDAEAKASLRHELGLDRPIHVQYATWMGRLLRGDLGHSIRNGEPVIENVTRRIRPSLELASLAMAVSLLAAVITRTLRSSMLEALAEDYVRTARAKGLSEWRVIRGHVLKNALIPVVTVLGLQLGTLIGGAVITEYVFALPGVGRLVVDAV